MNRRRAVPHLFFLLFATLVVGFFITNRIVPWYFCGELTDDLRHYYGYVQAARDGLWPYRDIDIEYPPLTVAAILLAGFAAAPSFEAFQMVVTGFNLVLLAALYLAAHDVCLEGAGRPEWKKEAAFFCAFGLTALSCGPVLMARFDLLFAALTFAAAVSAAKGRGGAAMASLGLAVGAKFAAAALAPMFLLGAGPEGRKWKPLAGKAAAFASAVLLCFLPAWRVGGEGVVRSFAYHGERGIEIGSLYGAAALTARKAGFPVERRFDHGSWNLDAGAAGDALAAASPLIQLALMGVVYFLYWRKGVSPRPGAGSGSRLYQAAFAAMLAFILGFKVGSPQFIVWLAPLLPAAFISKGRVDWLPVGLFAAWGHLQQWIYPWHWQALVYFQNAPVLILVLEKCVMIALMGVALARLNPRSGNFRKRERTILDEPAAVETGR